MAFIRFGPRWPLAAALLAGLAACSTDPYPIGSKTQPPWELGASRAMPALAPPLGARAWRLSFCYATPLNDEEEVLAMAEERCPGGRLVLDSRDVFWNGCGLLKPVRATYICDPATPEASERQ